MANAQTLTYDPTPADQPEFTEAEQEAIAIGESMAEAESQMLAGKFKDAEALEQAYIELQKKLGTNETNPDAEEAEPEEGELYEEEEEDDEEVDAVQSLLSKASEEFYANDGQISEEVLNELSSLESSDLIAAYINMQGDPEPTADFTEADIASIHEIAGGKDGYSNLTSWADQNMPREYVDAFNDLVELGNLEMVQLAVAGLQSQYLTATGYEGEMLTGRAASQQVDEFRSQAEVVAAMNDPRYDSDPAYRQDVFDKLGRSNINY